MSFMVSKSHYYIGRAWNKESTSQAHDSCVRFGTLCFPSCVSLDRGLICSLAEETKDDPSVLKHFSSGDVGGKVPYFMGH